MKRINRYFLILSIVISFSQLFCVKNSYGNQYVESLNSLTSINNYYFGPNQLVSIDSFDILIHPGQFLYSRVGVEYKKRKLLLIKEAKDIQSYLYSKFIPYVVGPKGNRWIIDRHHFSIVIVELRDQWFRQGGNFKKLNIIFREVKFYSNVVTSNMSLKEFEEFMYIRKLIFPFINGKRYPIEEIPCSVTGLKEDFYRGLAWLLIKGGAVDKTEVPYAEFFWGDYLRLKLKLKEERLNYKVVKSGIELALDDNEHTRALPGFIGNTISKTEKSKFIKDIIKKMKKKSYFVIAP